MYGKSNMETYNGQGEMGAFFSCMAWRAIPGAVAGKGLILHRAAMEKQT